MFCCNSVIFFVILYVTIDIFNLVLIKWNLLYNFVLAFYVPIVLVPIVHPHYLAPATNHSPLPPSKIKIAKSFENIAKATPYFHS